MIVWILFCSDGDITFSDFGFVLVGVVSVGLWSWFDDWLSLTIIGSVHIVTRVMSPREWCGQKPIPRCLLLAGQSLTKMFPVGCVSNGGFQMEESAGRALLWEMLASHP